MSYERPSLKQIAQQIENDIYSRFNGMSRPVRFSANKIIARVLAGSIHLVYGYIDWILKQILPDTAESEYLDRWALIWGVKRKPASFSIGSVLFRGTDGSKIPAFTKLQTNDHFVFQTLFDGIIKNGSESIKVQAIQFGKIGNLPAKTALVLISPIVGIESACLLDENGAYSGSDIENDDDLRGRVLDRIRNAPCAGNKRDYENWCLQISGVTRAWCYPQYNGDGNVGLTFVRDNDANLIPNSDQLQDVYNHILGIMPITANLKVFAPEPQVVDFYIKSNDISDALNEEIFEQLKILFFNIGSPNNTIYLSDIYESLSNLKSISRIVLMSPSADVVLGEKSVGVVGKIHLSPL